jgi:hypothetical protein
MDCDMDSMDITYGVLTLCDKYFIYVFMKLKATQTVKPRMIRKDVVPMGRSNRGADGHMIG